MSLGLGGCSGPGGSGDTYPLIVTRNGSGRVVSSPEGIDCGLRCSESFATGTTLTLTAVGDFTGWTGACTGPGPVCVVTVDGPRSVTASFREGSGGVDGGGDDCDPVAQSGCGAGEACDLDESTGARYCRAVGPGAADSTCAAPTDCAAGFSCVQTAPGWSSCRRFCQQDAHCPGPGALCVHGIAAEGVPTGLSVCSVDCTPPTAAGCPSGWGCHVVPATAAFSECLPAGSGGDLAPCASEADCQPGFVCIEAGQRVCLHYCTLPEGSECAPFAGSQCTKLNPPLVVGGTEYGVCV